MLGMEKGWGTCESVETKKEVTLYLFENISASGIIKFLLKKLMDNGS